MSYSPNPTALVTRESESWLLRSMHKRYGIGMMLALLLWPFAGFVDWFEAIIRNGMLIDTYSQLAFVMFVNSIALFFCTAMQKLLNKRFPGKWWHTIFNDGTQPWTRGRICCTFGLATVTPAILATFFSDDFSTDTFWHFVLSTGAVAVGLVVAFVLLLFTGMSKCWLFGSDNSTQNIFPFETRNRTELRLVSKVLNWIKSLSQN